MLFGFMTNTANALKIKESIRARHGNNAQHRKEGKGAVKFISI